MAHSNAELRMLARLLTHGPQTASAIAPRIAKALGKRRAWIRPLADRYLQRFGSGIVARERDLAEWLRDDKALKRAKLHFLHWTLDPPPMLPIAAAAAWGLPAITTPGDLADWLEILPEDLAWFADLKNLQRFADDEPLRHYRYSITAKPTGGYRLIEAPKPRLKQIQRRLLDAILSRIPAHDAAHGFTRGRSITTFAEPHAGQTVVLRVDLTNFFPTLSAVRVQTMFRAFGYPEAVADLLGGLCTNAVPPGIWPRDAIDERRLYQHPHVPQGAPTSPAVANICAFRLDTRLTGLAQSAGARYTRYADDLAFSGDGDFRRRARTFSHHVQAILLEEGFTPNYRKTRVMTQGGRQHLAGLVVNAAPNLNRRDFDKLKARLHKAALHGCAPGELQKLKGHVAYAQMVNPAKATRLERLLDQIRER